MSWWNVGAAVVSAVATNQQTQAAKGSANEAKEELKRQNALARGDLASYQQFGGEQLTGLDEWLKTPEGQFAPPTSAEVTASPGYQSRLGAVESSAAARGSLFSGNALRDVGQFGSDEYSREYGRKQTEYQNELNKRLGFVNLGYGAAGGSAGIAQDLGQRLSNISLGTGAAEAQGIGQTASGITGAMGSYQGQQNWNSFLDRIGSNKTNSQNNSWDDGNDYDSDIGW